MDEKERRNLFFLNISICKIKILREGDKIYIYVFIYVLLLLYFCKYWFLGDDYYSIYILCRKEFLNLGEVRIWRFMVLK